MGRRRIYVEIEKQHKIKNDALENLSNTNYRLFEEYVNGLDASGNNAFLESGFWVRAIIVGFCVFLVSMPFRHSFDDAVIFLNILLSDFLILVTTLLVTFFTNYLQTESYVRKTNLCKQKYNELQNY